MTHGTIAGRLSTDLLTVEETLGRSVQAHADDGRSSALMAESGARPTTTSFYLRTVAKRLGGHLRD